jgi:two-component sensor histidine kinase
MQLVHGLTEQIGGRIRFTTNGGTTVAVSFPVAAAEHKAQ